jgi:hypothetical protein
MPVERVDYLLAETRIHWLQNQAYLNKWRPLRPASHHTRTNPHRMLPERSLTLSSNKCLPAVEWPGQTPEEREKIAQTFRN